MKHKKDGTEQVLVRSKAKDDAMDFKNLVTEIEDKLLDAVQRRFTGEIRLIFNVSQGGFSTSYIESERENLVRKRERKKK